MKKILLVTMVTLVAVPVALAAKPTTPGSNGNGGHALVAKLSGAAAGAHTGDHGNAVIRLNAKTLKVCWSFSAFKLTANGTATTTPTQAHIHIGGTGVAGSVLVALETSAGAGFSRRGCTTTSKANIDAILANPKGYYVNVHSASYPGGAIRGQLKKGAPTV